MAVRTFSPNSSAIEFGQMPWIARHRQCIAGELSNRARLTSFRNSGSATWEDRGMHVKMIVGTLAQVVPSHAMRSPFETLSYVNEAEQL
ncbi:hypothetical protein KC325_g244 [Hortaea werneckii]|nr:hypothetical protein KC325_g244 [Hortaea werneckii]